MFEGGLDGDGSAGDEADEADTEGKDPGPGLAESVSGESISLW